MNIKDKFELIYKTTGEVYNIVPLNASTLQAYKLSAGDIQYIRNLASMFQRTKNHPGGEIVLKELTSINVIDLDMYPLPGFVTTKKIGAINLASLPQRDISDYNPVDIYALYLYAVALKKFVIKKPFSSDNAATISNLIFSIFMKMFGKSSGLVGSYSHLIPKLRFLIMMYVHVAFMGDNQDDRLKKKLASILYMDYNELDLNYDFTKVKDFLTSINKNGIIPLSEHTFSSKIINILGVSALPMFEDPARFYATVLASTVPGNSVFSGYLAKVNTSLFQKLVYTGLKSLR